MERGNHPHERQAPPRPPPDVTTAEAVSPNVTVIYINYPGNVSGSVQDQEDEMMEVDAFIEPIDEPNAAGEDVASVIRQHIVGLFANCDNVYQWSVNRELCINLVNLFRQQGASLEGIRLNSVHFFVRVKLGPDHDAFLRACTDGTLSRGLTKFLVTPELEEVAGVKLRLRLNVTETSNTSNVSAPTDLTSIDVREPDSNVYGRKRDEQLTEFTASVQNEPRTVTSVYTEFVSSPIGDKPVEKIAGIGPVLRGKLSEKGFDKASAVLGQYLVLKKNEESFTKWLKDEVDATEKQSSQCYQCVQAWCNKYM